MNTSSQTHSSIISTYYPPEIPSATLVFQSHQTPQTNSNTYGTVLVGQVNTLDRVNIPDGLDDSHCHQNTYYQYDKPDENFFEETGLLETDYRQTFLAGKLAKSSTDKPYMNTTWYSYDEQGRLVWMVQNIAVVESISISLFNP